MLAKGNLTSSGQPGRICIGINRKLLGLSFVNFPHLAQPKWKALEHMPRVGTRAEFPNIASFISTSTFKI